MNGDMNELLGRVLNDPAAMGNIMKIAQGLMNNPSPPSPEPEQEEPPAQNDNGNPAAQLPPGLLSGLPKILSYDENRANLLKALKPYLSDGRREKVEHILNILNILQMAGNLK